MNCTICKTEVTRIVLLMIEYLHVHGECDDVISEGTVIIDDPSITKIQNYCNLLATFENTTDLIDNIKRIDITGKTYNTVRHELSQVHKAWLVNLP